MCGAIFTPKIPSPPPAPEPIPAVDTNPTIANAVTKQKAPNIMNEKWFETYNEMITIYPNLDII